MVLSKRKLSPWFLLALLVILGWISLKVVGVFLNYILMGLFIAYLTHPVYDWLEVKVRWKPLASLLMVIFVVGAILVPVAWLMVELVGELRNILISLDGNVLREQLGSFTDSLLRLLGQEPGPNGDEGPGFVDFIVPSLNSFLSQFASRLLAVVAEAIVGIFVMIYVLYYAYQDGHRFVDNIRDLLPLQEAHRDLLIHEIGNVIKAVIYGHVLTAVIQAILGVIGFAIFGVPNLIFWGALMFILALLPVVGPPLIWLPWGIYLVLSGDTFSGIGLLIYSAIMVSSLDNIIRPKLIGDRAHVHPTIVLVGVLGGIVVFGFAGLILGPLVLSIFVTILQVYRKEFATRIQENEAGA